MFADFCGVNSPLVADLTLRTRGHWSLSQSSRTPPSPSKWLHSLSSAGCGQGATAGSTSEQQTGGACGRLAAVLVGSMAVGWSGQKQGPHAASRAVRVGDQAEGSGFFQSSEKLRQPADENS